MKEKVTLPKQTDFVAKIEKLKYIFHKSQDNGLLIEFHLKFI